MTTVADWRIDQKKRARALRGLLLDHDLKQVDVAEVLDIAGPHMSEFLNARRRWPDDFEQQFKDAVAGLAGAKAASR